jgi:hypothetical protein
MDEIIGVILVIVLVCVSVHIFVSVLEFICEVPKQLKRIADALEKGK